MRNYCLILKNNYQTEIIFFLLFLLNFAIAFPGGMTIDSINQFEQSLTGDFESHHPPVMAFLWHIFNYIYQGPELMLVFNLSLLWISIYFLYYTQLDNKYKFLYYIIPFLPHVFTQTMMIWKDVVFAHCFLLIFSVCIYYQKQNVKIKFTLFIALILLAFIGMSVKFQAQYCLVFLILLLFKSSFNSNRLMTIISSILITTVIISANNFIISKYVKDTNSWQLRQIFDLSAIVKDAGNDDLLPEYVRNNEIYNYQKLLKNANHTTIDLIIYDKDAFYKITDDKSDLDALNQSFLQAIIKHPFFYLKHRCVNFYILANKLVGIRSHIEILKESYEYINHTKYINGEYLYNIFTFNYLELLRKFPRFLTSNIFLIILLIIGLILNCRFDELNKQIIIYANLICLTFLCFMMFKTLAADYRYLYIVRIFGFILLPILLNNIQNKKAGK